MAYIVWFIGVKIEFFSSPTGPSSVIVAGGDMEADGVASSSNEEVRAHSRIQVDGDEVASSY